MDATDQPEKNVSINAPHQQTETPKSINKIALIVAAILLLGVGFGGGYLFANNSRQPITQNTSYSKTTQPSPSISATAENSNACQKYGVDNYENFLRKYIVKKGDTLLSIAKNELGDASRINELITLNKERYPELTVKNPFLEVGWELYLSPAFITKSSGNVMQLSGVLESMDGSHWSVRIDESQKVINAIYLQPTTQMADKTTFAVGDCISVLMEEQSHDAYRIEKQEEE